MSQDLRVEKRQQKVSLFMADGVILEGVVYLAQYAMYHSGEQTMLDLVLEEDPFLPLKGNDGKFHLVRKGMISHLRCAVDLPEEIDYTRMQVQISFLGNEHLLGTLAMNMPSHRARLKDYLNTPGNEFFPLFCAEHSYLVNRSLIRDIVGLD